MTIKDLEAEAVFCPLDCSSLVRAHYDIEQFLKERRNGFLLALVFATGFVHDESLREDVGVHIHLCLRDDNAINV